MGFAGSISRLPQVRCNLILFLRALSMSRALSQGVVLEAVDSDGWVTVQWASGSQNKYRYRPGAYDVQLLGSGLRATVATDAATAAAAGRHSGEWRDQSTKRYHCSVPGMVEGALCSHGGGILQVTNMLYRGCAQLSLDYSRTSLHFPVQQVSHWSCCGGVQLETPCKPADCSQGSAAADRFDSDEVTSSELDSLTQVSCPSPFVISAATREEMSHAPCSCALLFRAFRLRPSHRFTRGWGTKWTPQLRLACLHARSRIASRVTVC